MQVCKYKGMYVCNHARIKVSMMCMYAIMKVYTDLQLLKYQLCKCKSMKIFMYKIYKCAGLQIFKCLYACMQVYKNARK